MTVQADAAQANPEQPKERRSFARLFSYYWQRGGIWASLAVIAFFLSFLNPNFLTRLNLVELLNYTSVIAIVAIGQTFVIAGRGIDLSVGSVVALTACIMASLSKDFGLAMPVVVLIGLAIGIAVGALHGFLIARLGVPDLVVTLAGLEAWRGVTYLLFEGRVISSFDWTMRFAGSFRLFGWLPMSVVLLVVLTLMAAFVLRFTFVGRYILAIGGSRKAAEYAGINYERYKIVSYALSGMFAAIAAWVLLGQLNAAQSSMGLMYELQSIAAVVIGGSSLFGGAASILSTIGGSLLIAMVRNGLLIGGVPYFWYMVILGVLMVAAVAIPAWDRRKEAR